MRTVAPVCVGVLTVTRRFGFCASHELRELPEDHKCRRNHGHNYTATVTAVLPHGEAAGVLWRFEACVRGSFDHRLLNDVLAFHPTSENLVAYLADWFEADFSPGCLLGMEVSETDMTSAHFDGATRAVTITRTAVTPYGEVALVVGADVLDEFGFVTDFGDLAPFTRALQSVPGPRMLAAGPALPADIARWFIDDVEPRIHGRLESVRVSSARGDARWDSSR